MQGPILRLCLTLLRCQSKKIRSGDVFLLQQSQEVLGGGANSPSMQPSLHRQNCFWAWCHVVRTQHQQPATRDAETILDQLMVLFQHWAGSADDDIILFLVGGKNCSWQLHDDHEGDLLVWALKLDPSLHQDTIEKLSSKAFDWCNNDVVVLV
jgi:hypothetical protein